MRRAWLILLLFGCESGRVVRPDAPVSDAQLSVWVIADEDGAVRRGVDVPSRRVELAPGERLIEAPLTAASLGRAPDADLNRLSEATQVACNLECTSAFDDSQSGFVTTDVARVAEQIFRLGSTDDAFSVASDDDRALFECIQLPRRPDACAPVLNEARDFQPFGLALEPGTTIAGEPAHMLFDQLVRIDDDHLVVAARQQHIYWFERGRRFADEAAQRVAIEEHGIDPLDVLRMAAEGESDAQGRRHLLVVTRDHRANDDSARPQLRPSKALELIVGPQGFESTREVALPEEVIRDVTWVPDQSRFMAVGHNGAVWTATSAAGTWVIHPVEVDDFQTVIATGSEEWPIAIATRGGSVWLGDVDDGFEIIPVFRVTTVTALAARVIPASADEPERLEVWVGGRVGQTGRIVRPGTGSEERTPGFPNTNSCGREPDACGRHALPGRVPSILYLPSANGPHLLTGASNCGNLLSVRTGDDCAAQLAWPSFTTRPPTTITADERWITALGPNGIIVEVRR